MIDNNVDRMSVNILPFSLDRALSVGNRKSEDPDLFFIINQINQDQLVVVSSLRTDQPGFFCVNISSQITGNEVLISYRKSDIGRLD